jgi:two-component system, NtrC family, sensor kinase
MATYELVLAHPDGVSERFAVDEAGLSIGRSPNSNIVLADKLVSRQHARIWMQDGAIHFKDLDSRNGVEINNQRLSKGIIAEGDVLQIGGSTFHVVKTGGSNLGRSIISEEKAKALHNSILSEAGSGRMAVLYRAATLMGTIFDLDVLFREILGLIFEALPVRRGFVIILDSESGEPEVHGSYSLEPADQGPPLSRTLIQHVFDNKSSILTTDAQDDSRFDQADSIIGHQIHSAMCAPLRGREEIVGAIYVDSGVMHRPFTAEDLGLLTTITLVVGVAVENARLYKDNMEKERLAAVGLATAGLGHCVKNILTGVRGGSEFIGMALKEENLKYLQTGWPILSRAIDRIDGLVMNMLTFSRDRKPERCPTDINSIIRDIMDGLRGRAEKNHVALAFEETSAGIINVDGQQVFRVVQNLTLNAIEACESSGGRVNAFCEYDENGCTFRVIDTGIGIPAEMLPHLSEAFVSSKGSSGTGLGLACSYKIVREHNGTIDVDSTEGKGTEFTVFLPHLDGDTHTEVKISD